MSKTSRDKGARFERETADELHSLTGVTFSRNLAQYQAAGGDDLRADDPDWPFSIECKRRASGDGCAPGWKTQAQTAAKMAGKFPAVIYRYDRRQTRCAVPVSAISAALGGDPDESGAWAEINLETFAMLAAEMMARAAE